MAVISKSYLSVLPSLTDCLLSAVFADVGECGILPGDEALDGLLPGDILNLTAGEVEVSRELEALRLGELGNHHLPDTAPRLDGGLFEADFIEETALEGLVEVAGESRSWPRRSRCPGYGLQSYRGGYRSNPDLRC